MPWTKAAELSKARNGGIEDLLYRYGKPLLVVDLGNPGPFDKKLACGFLGYSRGMVAPWSQVMDCIVYTEAMAPSTYAKW